MRKLAFFLPLFLSALLTAQDSNSAINASGTSTIQIMVDATEAPRRLFHAKLRFPVKPGPLTLYYPKWIPGEHEPSGPQIDTAGMVFTVNGQTVAWTRDDVDMFAIHLTVPDGATELDAALDFLATAGREGYSAGASTTSQLAVISWNQMLLYPAGKPIAQLIYAPSLRVPEGWKTGTALTLTGDAGDKEQHYQPVSLEMLIDSPVIAGAHFREIPLDDAHKHFLDMAADGDAALEMPNEVIASYRRLITEGNAMFGAHHYDSYHFLVTLSDHVSHFGLEHHQSSDDRVGEKAFVDEGARRPDADLLSHEYTHSWNGKYRRPAGLATSDYQQPMKGNLLWVYEGLTEYVGGVLAARSGLWTPGQWRDRIAIMAGHMDTNTGRTWRNLQDTATDAQLLYEASEQWGNWRRGTDFYSEGALLWLEVDTMIRQQTKDKRSLNDFCRRFYGPPSSGPRVVPYTFEDIVANLAAIVPYDWAKFFEARLNAKAPHAPMGGIENGGWTLAYGEIPNELEQLTDDQGRKGNFRYSLGLIVHDDGSITDVIVGSPAYQANLGPGMRVLAVNGRRFSLDGIHQAVRASKHTSTPMELIVENTDYISIYRVDYHDGERYPALQRVDNKGDLLTEIVSPLAAEAGK